MIKFVSSRGPNRFFGYVMGSQYNQSGISHISHIQITHLKFSLNQGTSNQFELSQYAYFGHLLILENQFLTNS